MENQPLTEPLNNSSAASLTPTKPRGRRCLSEAAIHRIGNYTGDDLSRARKNSAPNPGNENSVPLLATHELNSSLIARKGIGGSAKSVDEAAGPLGEKKLRKRSFFQSLRLKSSSVMNGLRTQYVERLIFFIEILFKM